jgi:hypothetical protein
VTPHERFGDDEPAPLGLVEGVRDIRRPARVGLLAEDVLARVEGVQRPRVVKRVRQGNVDSLDLRIREQLLVGAVRARDCVLLRIGGRALEAAARDCRDLEAVLLPRAREQLAVDPGRREDPPADRLSVRHGTSRSERSAGYSIRKRA